MSTETVQFRRRQATLSATAGASDTYIMPSDYDRVSVSVHPGTGGTATLDISCASPAEIAAGEAEWVAVQFGANTDVSDNEAAEISPAVSAVRLSATTSDATAHVSMLDTRER